MKNLKTFIKILEDAQAASGGNLPLDNAIALAKGNISGVNHHGTLVTKTEDAVALGYCILDAVNNDRDYKAISSDDIALKLSELLTLDAELEANPSAKDIILSRYKIFSVEVKDADNSDSTEKLLSDKYKGLKESFSHTNDVMADAIKKANEWSKKSGEKIGQTPAYKPETKQSTGLSSSKAYKAGWTAGKIVGTIAAVAGIGLATYAAYSWWNSDVVYGGDDLDHIDLGI